MASNQSKSEKYKWNFSLTEKKDMFCDGEEGSKVLDIIIYL